MPAINPFLVEASTGVRWLKDRATGKLVGFVDDGGRQYRVLSTEDVDGVMPSDAPYDLTMADVAATKGLVSGGGNQPSATLAATVGTTGQTVRLSDGPDRGAVLIWATPADATSETWCWWLWPQSAYEAT